MKIQFLDLTDIDESELNHLQQVLYTVSPSVKLPWEVRTDYPCTSEYGSSPYAVAPLALRGVFLPQPLYSAAPAAVPVGLVPSVTATEPPNGPSPVGLVPAMDSGLECNSSGLVTSQHHHMTAETVYQENVAQVPVMTVPPPVSVPPPAQPVMTSIYNMIPAMPLPNVYVGNVTANVNVQSYVGSHLATYPQQPQVYQAPNESSVPHEMTSPNATRNSSSVRRNRGGKVSNKRAEGGQYVNPRSSASLVHEVLTPTAVMESPPTSAPLQPQNYHMYPVPPIPYHQQTYYTSTAQSPHAGHLSPHPSAQHATGPPLFLQNIYTPHPQPIYSTFPPHQPHLYTNALPAAAVPSTESSTVTGYGVEDLSNDRVIVEEKEIEDLNNIQPTQHVPSYQSDVAEDHLHHNGNDSVKTTQDIDTESCNVVSSVVVNNSNMLGNSSQFTSDRIVHHQNVTFSEVRSESVNNNYTPSEPVTTSEVVQDSSATSNVLDRVPNSINTDSSDSSVPTMEVKRDNIAVQTSQPEKSQKLESVKSVPGVPSLPFPSNQKNLAGTSTPFQRQSGANFPGTPSEVNSPVTPSQTPLDRSWASLFNNNASGVHINSPLPFDTARIPTGHKPVATVPPFPSSTAVVTHASDAARKPSDCATVSSASVSEASKNFPPLTRGQSPASMMDPNLYRLGEFLAKYQLEHKAISLQPRGLTNRSNWCYINSTLQALLACPPFYNLMKSLPLPARRSGKSSTPIIDSMCQFVNEFVPLSATSRVNRKEKAQRKDENFEVQAGAAFEPNYIYKMLSNIQSDTFKVEGRQEDAEEFLSCLLNAINDEMLELIKLVEDPSSKSTLSNGDLTNGDAASQSQDDEDEDGWKVMGPKNKGSITRRADFGRTPVSDIFRGELRSRVHRAGDESTDSVQPFFTLQLDIEKAQSVKDALELLVGRDQLEGVTCSKTNQEVEAWQQVTLQELPLVLILHLKWFDYKLDGCSKIVKTVEFPIDLSVDAKLMSSTKNYNRTQKKYKLFAVVYHDGKEATKGHYITDVYHVGYGGWVRYDDSVVKAVQEASMLHPRGSRVPYLLYYRRCDTIGSGAMTPDKSR
ncbi:ubiquitin carboxyl-terminal hydrolase 10 isoform X2 [Anabrus simplex]|uniref:ubiquitin carboxyl-terminal hydrolase 10 isoform X2 n=1 Tax=Anabrus simplex TaxID=316456 RepID=UPI0035A2C57F